MPDYTKIRKCACGWEGAPKKIGDGWWCGACDKWHAFTGDERSDLERFGELYAAAFVGEYAKLLHRDIFGALADANVPLPARAGPEVFIQELGEPMPDPIAKLFEHHEDYPGSDDAPVSLAERGVPQGTHFCFVASWYLDGLVNYINAFALIGPQAELAVKGPHTVISTAVGCDRAVVLGETETSWWALTYDADTSDCCIGRIDKSLHPEVNRDMLVRLVQRTKDFDGADCTEDWLKDEVVVPKGGIGWGE